MKRNCWEVMKCGRESQQSDSDFSSACPVLKEDSLNGVHGGRGAGRACWVVKGTLCGGTVQGMFAEKLGRCVMCDFYKMVRSEEKDEFKIPGQIIDIVISKYAEA